jgi:hypothetical protein
MWHNKPKQTKKITYQDIQTRLGIGRNIGNLGVDYIRIYQVDDCALTLFFLVL